MRNWQGYYVHTQISINAMKKIGAPLLGLAKYIYYVHTQISINAMKKIGAPLLGLAKYILFYFPSSRFYVCLEPSFIFEVLCFTDH